MKNALTYYLIDKLFKELDDALSFMERFESDDEEFKENLRRKASLLLDIDELDLCYETCDRCGKRLNKLRNEDIYLELINMVLCSDCHSLHSGLQKYWSKRSLKEYEFKGS